MTRSEREWVRRQDSLSLDAQAGRAEARFASVSLALTALLADTRTIPLLATHGIDRVALGRSSRVAMNGRAEGLSVLEGVVLSGMVTALLADADLVRWMSRHHPEALATLDTVCK